MIAPARSEQTFARVMRDLEGQAFEDEVCAFLQRSITDFHTVPARPRGDGGLDGYSHKQSYGYCCFGPQAASKQTTAKLKTAIVNKFRGDLRTLFELKATGKGEAKLEHCETAALKGILKPGRKLKVVRLIASDFDRHQVLGPLANAFANYAAASKCRYVETDAELTIWGPEQLAAAGAVDDLVLARLEHGEMQRRVAAAGASASSPSPPPELDAKLDWLASEKRVTKDAVERMRGHLRKRWTAAIAAENDLANNAPSLHAAFAQAREAAGDDADPAASPPERLARVTQRLGERLDAKLPQDTRNSLVDGELARLMGEGPLDWRPV